ncbi:D-alanyl-lipoteichoic acid biosynthesis protein DltD [Streptococcus porci]|uniref:D-alanyl-lipoteichoic acid biosynthesis protein DltD n=1 Tax=Streptococcus porci TaxID=502567 RepID=UPI0004144D73|nr:D-alanyl-lipoteichoic acid biosynthesis protein DltD [Streptococcus porci]
MLKRLWQILGPILCAFLLASALIGFFPSQITYSKSAEKKDAVALSTSQFKSRYKKNRALSDNSINFVPFFGSSEWSRFDIMHPSVLAEAYNRSYTPYLLGQRGAASLTHFFGSQEIADALKGKQAVYFVSPQWFVKEGTNANAFQKYLSTGQIAEFLATNKGTEYDSYAAKRLLEIYPQAPFQAMLTKVSGGENLNDSEKASLDFQRQILLKEDNFFGRLAFDTGNYQKVQKQAKKLPQDFSYASLEKLAIKDGRKKTSNNEFGIKNHFYTTRIASHKERLRGSQVAFDYRKSPEYQDFQLMLQQFAESETNVIFVIPPVNDKWAAFTGLNQDMYQQAVAKIKHQLESQGFTNIADFSKDGAKPYFMQDTIHMGWIGWLEMDKQINPFLTQQAEAPTYKLNSRFLSQDWANYTGSLEEFK